MKKDAIKKIESQKTKILKKLPPLSEVLRGTLMKCYLECIRPNCKCHKAKKHRHGPYYRISYGQKGRMRHVYVPKKILKTVRRWTKNYDKIWKWLEEFSKLNVRLIREKSKK